MRGESGNVAFAKQRSTKDGTFLTSVDQTHKRNFSKKSLDENKGAEEAFDAGNFSDIDLNMEYSDAEDRNYFESDKAVLNHLFSIEESNLFKIKHLEDAE